MHSRLISSLLPCKFYFHWSNFQLSFDYKPGLFWFCFACFIVWLVQKTRTISSTDQMRLGCPRFPALSRALGSSFVFTRNFHWLMMMLIPAVIGRCYYFCFGTSSFDWKLLKHLFKATLLSLPSSWKRNVKYVFLKSALCWMILDIHQQEIFLTIEVQLNRSPFASCLSPVLQFSLSACQLVVLNHEGLLEDARSLYCLKCQRECLA